MSLHRFLFISMLGAGIAAMGFADDSSKKTEQPTTSVTKDYLFAPVTLTSTETARVIVVNTAPPATGNATAPSCVGTISFMTSGTSQPTIAVNYTIGAGKFAVADLPYGSSGITPPPGEVVGKIETKAAVPANAPCSLSTSLVVFDTTTGAAHVFVPGPSTQLNGIPPGLIGR